jgi:hypothetical protein
MAKVTIENENDLGREIAKLARQLKFVDSSTVVAYQHVRIDGKPFKIIIQQIKEADFK